jgi:hypothetical protein
MHHVCDFVTAAIINVSVSSFKLSIWCQLYVCSLSVGVIFMSLKFPVLVCPLPGVYLLSCVLLNEVY